MRANLEALDLAYPVWNRPVKKRAPVDISVYTQVARVFEEKKQLFEKVDTSTFEKRPISLIAGDLSSFGFLGLSAAKIILPVLKTIAVISLISAGFGLTAGVINLAIVLVVVIPAIAKAYEKGDMRTVITMVVVAVALSGLSLIMVSEAVYGLKGSAGLLGKMGAYFAAHPGYISFVVGMLTLNMVVDVVSKLRNSTAETLVTRLNEILEERDFRKKFEKARSYIQKELVLEKGRSIREQIIRKLSQLEKDVGVKAAMVTFELFQIVMAETQRSRLSVNMRARQISKGLTEEIDDTISKVKDLVADWRRTLWIRAFQQALYIAATVIGVAETSVQNTQAATMMSGVNTGILALGNGVAFYLDAFKPYGRNTPLVVPSPSVDE